MTDPQLQRSIAVPRPIPVVLSVVAGYVDACTYLGLYGVFVAQLTGSFVLSGTEFVHREPGAVAKILAIPSFFVAAMAITLLAHPLRQRPRAALARSFGLECLLLTGFLAACLAGTPFAGPDAPAAVVALQFGMAAMGAQSALVRLLMRGVASTNVMTTNTTMLAIQSAELLLGRFARSEAAAQAAQEGHAQARRELAALLPLALGFFAGTALGAIAYMAIGLACLFLAILPVGGLALGYFGRK